jgi:hypothetical protein
MTRGGEDLAALKARSVRLLVPARIILINPIDAGLSGAFPMPLLLVAIALAATAPRAPGLTPPAHAALVR